MIQNTKIVNNFFMELKNANPNDCNVVLYNNQCTPYIFNFFPKILKIE